MVKRGINGKVQKNVKKVISPNNSIAKAKFDENVAFQSYQEDRKSRLKNWIAVGIFFELSFIYFKLVEPSVISWFSGVAYLLIAVYGLICIDKNSKFLYG